MKIGFLGCGNMGGALCRAVRRADATATLLLTDTDTEKRDRLAAAVGGCAVDAPRLFAESDYLFLGLKPQVLALALAPLSEAVASSHAVFISMAAGVSLDTLGAILGKKPIIRIMPNTAVEIGEGMTVYATSQKVTPKATEGFLALMAASGCCDALPEGMIDAASAVSGCGPAFAYLFLNALADGGVECGLPRERALAYAAQTVKGAMQMVQASGRHPEELKDAVCSPGGSTIVGVHALEAGGLRAAASDAVCAAYRRTKELSGGAKK